MAGSFDAEAAPWHSRLWRKQAWVLSLLVALAISAFGIAEMAVNYNEALRQTGKLQQSQARDLAQSLDASLAIIRRQVEAVTVLPWSADGLISADTRREEYGRLLRLIPAIESIAFRDQSGRELLMVSRREADRWTNAGHERPASASPGASGATGVFTAIEYRDDYDPHLLFDISFAEPEMSGRTQVRIALRALAKSLFGALSQRDSEVYVVDASGTVVLHRDPSLILERVKLESMATPDRVSRALMTDTGALGIRGGHVLRSFEPVPSLDWHAVVEQPLTAAMEPVWATLKLTAAFMLVGMALAMIAALYLAGRLTRPIRELHQGVRRLGAGSLTARVDVRTGDELESLADRFNEMADSLNASVTQLESRVAEKTHELEVANRHKSEFLANMSHELRTPLNAIIGNAGLLRGQRLGSLGADQIECVDDVHDAGRHLLSLINDILDLSKIEAGRLDLELAEVDVGRVIADALQFVRERATRGGLQFEVDVAPDVQLWHADERRLKQILVNLLSNAVKFTNPGGKVRVLVKRVDAEGLRFEVSDTGIGVAEDDLGRIFEPFGQVARADPRSDEGTGLGLPLVRQFVELHGGRIAVTSRLGEGTSFAFNIPYVENA